MNKLEVKIKIKSNSASAKVMKRYMAEKAAFKDAVTSGNVSSFVKKRGTKFDSPVSLGV